MSEQERSMRVDAVFDRTDWGIDDPSDSVLRSARMLVNLGEHDRAVPSPEFVDRLRRELFATKLIVAVAPPVRERPAALPRSGVRNGRRRTTNNRLLAVAASLVLLVGGMGAVLIGPYWTDRDQEPSTIPAVSFASPESNAGSAIASSAAQPPALPVWTAAAPEEAGFEVLNQQLAGGRIFRAFEFGGSFPYIQAIDVATGEVLWEQRIASEAGIMVASEERLVVVEGVGEETGGDLVHVLVGLDARSGGRRWEITLDGPPVAAVRMGDQVLVLDWTNTLTAVDLEDGRIDYSADVGGASQLPEGLPANFGTFYFDPGRIATIGAVVAVVLADGTVAAIDGETGTGLWWMYPTLYGGADVVAAGDRLVISIGGTFVVPGEATPLPAVATPAPADWTGCNTALSAALAGTPIGSLTPPIYAGLLYGVDPATGEVAWSGTTELFIDIRNNAMRVSGDRLLLDTTDWSGGVPTAGEWCVLDATTGAITPLTAPASIALGAFVNDLGGHTTPETIAVFDNGQFVAYPTGPDAESTLPVVNLSPYLSGAFAWVELYEGDIYVSMADGTLMKFDAETKVTVD